MSDQFMDTSNLLGVLPHAEDSKSQADNSQDQADVEAPNESDDPGQDQEGMNASDDDLQPNDDADDAGADDNQQDDPGDDSGGWQQKFEVAERDRRDWQSKANSSDADLGKALDALRSTTGANNGNRATPAQPATSTALKKLEAMEGDELVDASTIKEVLSDFIAEQQADRNTAQQKNQLDDLNSKMTAELRGKSDLREVTDYFKQHLSNSPEASMMTDLGLYHFSRGKMLENQNSEAFNKGKTEGAKGAADRQKRLKDLPSQTGSQGQRNVASKDPSGVVDILLQRRKARGIRTDGSIR